MCREAGQRAHGICMLPPRLHLVNFKMQSFIKLSRKQTNKKEMEVFNKEAVKTDTRRGEAM